MNGTDDIPRTPREKPETRTCRPERIDTLQAIADSARGAREAIAAQDLSSLRIVAAERRRLLGELQKVDARLRENGAKGPAALQERALALHRAVLDAERSLCDELARWRDETQGAIVALRRARQVRGRYAASAQGIPGPSPASRPATTLPPPAPPSA